jgi:hypothetical protein
MASILGRESEYGRQVIQQFIEVEAVAAVELVERAQRGEFAVDAAARAVRLDRWQHDHHADPYGRQQPQPAGETAEVLQSDLAST